MLACIFISSSAMADDDIALRIFDKTGGDPIEIALDDISKITFEESCFNVFPNNITDSFMQFEYDNVQSMKFGFVATAIDNISNGKISFAYDGNNITLSNCDNNSKIMIYDVAGRPVISSYVSGNGVINTQSLSPGIYILKVNNNSFKFNKL